MIDKKKYHAFISYSHKDKAYATIIQKSIESLGLPVYKKWKSDVNIFRDERKLPLVDDLSKEIKEGLSNSENLIVIASPNSANLNSWVIKEIEYWYEIKNNNNTASSNFYFILIDGIIEWDYTNNCFSNKSTAIPFLETVKITKLPVWANLQHYCTKGKIQTSNANYEWEIAKIKALLLHKKPDEIIDEASKAKRFFRIVVSATILVLLGLTIVAFIQRKEALLQESIAIEQKKIAENKTVEALTNLRNFKIEEFERNFKNGNTYLEAEEYCFAKKCFTDAIMTAKDTSYNTYQLKARIRYLDSVITLCNSKSDCQ